MQQQTISAYSMSSKVPHNSLEILSYKISTEVGSQEDFYPIQGIKPLLEQVDGVLQDP
jgi:hypothetical protein